MKINWILSFGTGALASAFLLAAIPVCNPAESAVVGRGPNAKGADPTISGEEIAVLTQAPNVPPPIKRSHATKVIVKLEVKEVVKKLSDGVEYLFWTFGGDVPGSFIRYGFRSSLKASYTVHNLGFRCARSLNKETL